MTMVGGFSCHISRQKSTSVLGIGPTASGLEVRIMNISIVKSWPDLTLSSYEFAPALIALQVVNRVKHTHKIYISHIVNTHT